MDERCKKCALPGIVEALRASRAGAQSAQANALLAGSPTEQDIHQQIADTLSVSLRLALAQRREFFETFGSACEGCLYC